MLQIDDKIISMDLFEECFACDISKCFGACCVHGDSGAPLEEEERDLIEEHFTQIEQYLTTESLSVIRANGIAVIDSDSELVTPLVGDSEECVYSFFAGGVCQCAIEKAYRNGDIPFNKPISCHLYPIRTKTFGDCTALNYNRWSICAPAREHGATTKTPVFMFLREPLIRKFGEDFYKSMEDIWHEISKN